MDQARRFRGVVTRPIEELFPELFGSTEMATKKKYKLKNKRAFLEPAKDSNSFYDLNIDASGYVTLTLHDCDRKITWYFSKPGEDRGKKKIAVIKKLVDDIYNHIHEIE